MAPFAVTSVVTSDVTMSTNRRPSLPIAPADSRIRTRIPAAWRGGVVRVNDRDHTPKSRDGEEKLAWLRGFSALTRRDGCLWKLSGHVCVVKYWWRCSPHRGEILMTWRDEWHYWVRCRGPMRLFFTGVGANRWYDRMVAAGEMCASGPRHPFPPAA